MKTLTNIYDQTEILAAMAESFDLVTQHVEACNEAVFEEKMNGKWSIRQNLDHLIVSTRPVASALKLPKITFRAFGRPNRPSENIDAIISRYRQKLAEGLVAAGKYLPSEEVKFSRNELMEQWKANKSKMSERIATWRDKDLDKYILPHPVLGKLTVREMLFFTIYHNHHHLAAMQKIKIS